ncbi:hypothetical protein HK099_003547 [Clydaea vesicula]|uniref:AAA+ ATPase domain-containing protein n=1 Tax=Clydaea vesicula TaxID=447962 RepID=A0AAD5U1I7_9FUNG|nr:hypothetical protein HK099_003547 [Clydaea vesicula]
MNENEEIANLTKIENQILKLLDAQYKLSLTIHDFQSSAVLHERVNNLIIELRNLDNLKNLSNLKIPPQLIEYIHNNKNPDIYSKQLFQSLADKNQKTSGRINAIKVYIGLLLPVVQVNDVELVFAVTKINDKNEAEVYYKMEDYSNEFEIEVEKDFTISEKNFDIKKNFLIKNSYFINLELKLKSALEAAFYVDNLYLKMNIKPPISVALVGANGVGKRTTLRKFCIENGISIFNVSLSETCNYLESLQFSGSKISNSTTYSPFRAAIEKARLCPPSLILLTDFDLAFQESNKKTSMHLSNHVSFEIDRLIEVNHAPGFSNEICIIGMVDDPLNVPSQLQQKEFFNVYVNFELPIEAERCLIIKSLFQKYHVGFIDATELNNHQEFYASELAQATEGYTIDNFNKLFYHALEYPIRNRAKDSKVLKDGLENKNLITVTNIFEKMSLSENGATTFEPLNLEDKQYTVDFKKDFFSALKLYNPKTDLEFQTHFNNNTLAWDKIGGYENVKKRLEQILIWPFKFSKTYLNLGIDAHTGIILYGPSGCGKTALIHSLAAASFMNFIELKGHQIFSKYLGDSELTIRKAFASARKMAPCILLIEELDNIGTKRGFGDDGGTGVGERVLSTLLNEMDGIQSNNEKKIFVVGCTNRPEMVDEALLRPGRLDVHIYVPLPNKEDRIKILSILTNSDSKNESIVNDEIDFENFVDATEGFNCSDLVSLLREASMINLKEHQDKTTDNLLSKNDFILALEGGNVFCDETKKNLSKNQWWRPGSNTDVKKYERFQG